MASLDNDNEYSIMLQKFTIWTAYCSNKERSILDCVEKTHELLLYLDKTEFEEVWPEWLVSKINVVYFNRNHDDELLKSFFALNNKSVAYSCLYLLIHDTDTKEDIMSYFNNFIERFGENLKLLMLKLNWLTLSENYKQNIEEVEKILEKINKGI